MGVIVLWSDDCQFNRNSYLIACRDESLSEGQLTFPRSVGFDAEDTLPVTDDSVDAEGVQEGYSDRSEQERCSHGNSIRPTGARAPVQFGFQ